MSRYLANAKRRMNIYDKRKVRNVLSGNYGSVFKGRGMDFDDLRPYDYGDDVKDIDWKASARSRGLMIRRYVAVRKHNIMIVADAGRSMSALAPSGEKKSELALLSAGVIAHIAIRNDDILGMTFGNLASNTRLPLKEGVAHAENCLSKYEKAVSLDSEGADINALLSYVSKNYRERMFLFIITDNYSASKISESLLKRLRVRHEQMIIMIEDSPVTNPNLSRTEARDVDEDLKLPIYFRNNKKLRNAETKMRASLSEKTTHDLRRLGICSCQIESSDAVVPNIFKMLEEQKHVRR